MKDARFDALVREHFEKDIKKAIAGGYGDWEDTIQGRLALIILFDQFPRNIYRGTATAFKWDQLALDLSLRSWHDGDDMAMPLIERVFVYMPFMHAEDVEIQNLSLRCFERLVTESEKISPLNTHYFKYNLEYARKHRDIIEKFGRFPHRNNSLSRKSTVQELEFLEGPKSSF